LNAALNKLYFEDEPIELANDDPDFTFDESIFDDAATEILQNGGYTPEMLTKGACNSLVRETFKVLGGGALHGLGKEPDPEMASALRENAFVFSGFKIHNQLGEVTNAFKYMPELTDDKGNIRPFHEISKEVDRILADHKIRGINARYNQAYLRAEYNQAVQSAQMAAKYHDALSRKDYINLQYRTANDERVRSEHRKLHGVTLPVDDPFWNDYTPPLGWNCRCTIAEVLKDDYPVSDSTRATSTAEHITSAPKDKIFRFNPAKTLKVFPDKHPYFKAGGGVEKVVKKAHRIVKMMEESNVYGNLSENEKIAIAANNVEIEDKLSIQKGKVMKIDDADEQKANPKYGTDKTYSINCQVCTGAYLLRRRGFNVEAGSANDYLSKGDHWYEKWKNADGSAPKISRMNDWLKQKKYKTMTSKRLLEFLQDECKENGVYEISVGWVQKVGGGGHVTIIEKNDDGLWRVEPQKALKDKKMKLTETNMGSLQYIASKLHNCRGVIRIDNKIFNTDYIESINKSND